MRITNITCFFNYWSHLEDGMYQIIYKGVDPWISAIFNWDGPTYPNQSVMGVSTRDIFPVTPSTKDKRLYSDANCWVNMDQDQDGIPDRQIKKDDIVFTPDGKVTEGTCTMMEGLSLY